MLKINILGSFALACLALLLVVEAKSLGEPTERIIGGTLARAGQFPHQVSLRRTTTGVHFCGGVIIGDHIVLTSADCMLRTPVRPADVLVVAGTQRLAAGQGTRYHVTRITNHPQFNLRTMANDISVIRTTERIAFTNLVRAARLPTANVPERVPTTFSGWGSIRVGKYLCSQWVFKLIFQFLLGC